MTNPKPKVAFYWAASCGGCEITITELGMQLAVVASLVDIVFWPCVMDFKYCDVENMDDQEIDICFFNGAIRTSENEHLAHLLRRKSKTLVAFGACAHEGGIPGLANFYDRESILERVYDSCPSLDKSAATRPSLTTQVPEGEITLPSFYEQVKTLDQTVAVDYFHAGMPPSSSRWRQCSMLSWKGNCRHRVRLLGSRRRPIAMSARVKRAPMVSYASRNSSDRTRSLPILKSASWNRA